MIAIYNEQTEIFTKLIKQGVDVNFETKETSLTALEVAIRKENEVAVKTLLETQKIKNVQSYLMTACAQQNVSNVNQLIKYGADPNLTLSNGYSALMSAASFGSYEIVETLLKQGAEINHKREVDGITALMLATFNGEIQKVKLLLRYNADKYITDKNGKTALDYVDMIYERLNIRESTKNELRQLLK
jgi:ankyrin repeat protein